MAALYGYRFLLTRDESPVFYELKVAKPTERYV